MSQRFDFIETPLSGLFRVERKPIDDHRGFFSRFFCAKEFKEVGLSKPIAQINHTLTKRKGIIRGLHFQYPPYCETKIVSCIQGKVFDVAVDIRKGSQTFLQWHAEILDAESQSSLYIPDGFAHGFQTLTENCQLLYLHSNFYTQKAEAALNVFDPVLAIDWPLKVKEISQRDQNHPLLDSQFEGIEIT
jgi:dTDP-4-dehydrorhamnose 3,5-epimerase